VTGLPLPALDGRTPLGFLAALGILRLLDDAAAPGALQPRPRLSWAPETCTAVLHGGPGTVDDLVRSLAKIVHAIPDGGVLPDTAPGFPPPGEAPDRLRLPRDRHRELADKLWRQDGERGERWMASLVTDLSVDDRQRGDISLFTAPSGKQSMRTMLEKPLALVRANPQLLREAVTAWRRYPGVSGEYLDHRVLFDAVDASDGRSAERGVPGATWLALMSYPLLRTGSSGRGPITSGWQQIRPGADGRRFIYPLWSRALDTEATRVILTHPILERAQPGPPSGPSSAATVLSVFYICHAQRRRLPGRTFAGVLAPTTEQVRPRAGTRR
jgi:hypothetical protein